MFPSHEKVDSNIYLSRYPFRRLPGDEPAELVSKLRANNVKQAWTSSFDALLHRDLGAVNRRLASDCRQHGAGLLTPFGSVNPAAPDWREELRRCHEEYRMPGIRLFPSYHGYTLTGAPFTDLLAAAAQRRLIVQIVALVEDERTQHPAVPVQPVNLSELSTLVRRAPGSRVQVLNHSSRMAAPLVKSLADAGVYLDIAMVEHTHGIERLVGAVGDSRITLGSYYPFYYWESAALKLQEAGFDDARVRKLLAGNARQLLGGAR